MDIRLIAFDLDGTLLRSDKSISPRTMQALLAARLTRACSFILAVYSMAISHR